MAQIKVERKRSGAWVWLVLGLIVFAAVVWLLVSAVNREEEEPVGPMGTPETQSLAPREALLLTAETGGIPEASAAA